MTRYNGRTLDRRQVLKTGGVVIGGLTLGSAVGSAAGPPPGAGAGGGSGNTGPELVNAEETTDGAIVATDDDFVIAGQEIEVDGRDFYGGSEAAYVIYNDGYSGEISNNEMTVLDMPASPTFGIRVEGGEVEATGNSIDGDDALDEQFLSVGYAAGASGTIESNTLNGGHRVGILAEGSETDISIRDNEVIGLGAKSDGWAENGIQVSAGATAHVRSNTVADHWWDNNNFQSSGIILYQPDDDVHLQRNTIRDNDAGIALWGGNEHNAIHNTVEVTEADPGENGVAHYGAIVLATEDSGLRQNTIRAEDGDIGIVVYPSAENTKLIGNDVSGFEDAIQDQGDETKLPDPFDPDA
jgi:nitrous oxidase accessory protein NosD